MESSRSRPAHPVALEILEPLRVLIPFRRQNGTRLVHVHGTLGIVPLVLRDKADYHGGGLEGAGRLAVRFMQSGVSGIRQRRVCCAAVRDLVHANPHKYHISPHPTSTL
jgi:hypothetical protein